MNKKIKLIIAKYKIRRTVFSAEETVRRARGRLGEEKYNLVTNNCEHFAMWCKTGVSDSSQVKQFIRLAAKQL